MTSTLHDQLSRLADETPPPPAGPTGRELWDRGVRYRRRLRAGTAAIAGAALVALTALVGVTLQAAGPSPAPAPADAPAGIPSRIHTPSPWLPGTEDAGPPGQIVAMLGADRRSWTGISFGVVAVSAATGDYRFLDLPGWYAPEVPVLSPDGRHVAYWTTGPTTGTASTYRSGGEPPTGLAVYDTVTGGLVEHRFPTEHGLVPDGIGWRDSSHVQAKHWQLISGDDGPEADQGTADDLTFWQWDLTAPEPEPWEQGERLDVDVWGAPAAGRQAVLGRGGLWILDDAAEPRRIGASEKLMYGGGQAISPDGTRVAGIWGNGRPNDVAVLSWPTGKVDADRLQQAGNSMVVHGWTDSEHVAVTRGAELLREGGATGLFEVDATTGEVEELVRLPDDWYSGVDWASDLLDSPVVDWPAPPTPIDPRLVAGLAVAAVLAALLALWGWRRHVTP